MESKGGAPAVPRVGKHLMDMHNYVCMIINVFQVKSPTLETWPPLLGVMEQAGYES